MTVEEVLKQTGLSDEQIKALDAKAVAAFTGILSTADKDKQEALAAQAAAKAAQDAAELAQRSNVDFYETKIAPSLTGWEEEKQRIENDKARAAAEAAYYRTQAEEAKKSGFIPTEAPGFDPTKFVPPNPNVPPAQQRDSQGRYVTNVPGSTPGSPTFNPEQMVAKAGDAFAVINDIQWEHQRLYGVPLPISPSELVRQADAVQVDPKTYAARTYNWDARRQQIQQEEEKKKADAIRAEERAPMEQKLKEQAEEFKKQLAAKDREWSERVGSNPDIRRPEASRWADISRAVKADANLDPLNMTEQQRQSATRQMIRKDIEANQQVA